MCVSWMLCMPRELCALYCPSYAEGCIGCVCCVWCVCCVFVLCVLWVLWVLYTCPRCQAHAQSHPIWMEEMFCMLLPRLYPVSHEYFPIQSRWHTDEGHIGTHVRGWHIGGTSRVNKGTEGSHFSCCCRTP